MQAVAAIMLAWQVHFDVIQMVLLDLLYASLAAASVTLEASGGWATLRTYFNPTSLCLPTLLASPPYCPPISPL